MPKIENKIKNIGLIADGAQRWAEERNLSAIEGHRKALEKILEIPNYFFHNGVEIFSILIFPPRNKKLENEDRNDLMKLLKNFFAESVGAFEKNNNRVFFSGEIDSLPGDLPDTLHGLEDATKNNQVGTLNIYLNYDGRQEILSAVRKMIKNKVELDQVHEGLLRKYLYQGGLGDPDLIILAGGRKKISAFQLWQSAYSELYFSDKYWPDFEENDIDYILKKINE